MQYSLILKAIEEESFENTKLNALKQKLSTNQLLASTQIQKLSVLVSNINSIGNVLGAAIMNGFFFFTFIIYLESIIGRKFQVN